MSRDSILHTFVVAGALCVVCSVLVSAAAVGLRPKQEANKILDKRKNIIAVAELDDPNKSIDDIFAERIESKIIDLETGEYVDESVVDPMEYDQVEASKDPARSVDIPSREDIAGIGRREKYSFVYVVSGEDGSPEQYVLPVNGKGLWSTLYGFLSLDSDGKTIRGLTFYQHGETPGLGGEVDNPNWKAQWPGKKAFGPEGEIQIEVLKGKVVEADPKSQYQIDGLSGATITAKGVSQLVRFWLGDNGFGPFLDKHLHEGSES